MQYLTTALILALGAVCPAQAAPADCVTTVTPEQLVAIAPNTTDCAGKRANPECRTAQQAAAPISAGFKKYGVCAPILHATLISTILLESGEFQFQRNKFPGNPGQGTRNMQNKPFNVQYAKALGGAIAEEAAKLVGATPPAELSNKTADAVLDLLVMDDAVDFGSAAWYFTSQADCKDVTLALLNDPAKGFEAYVTKCLGAPMATERKATFDKAVEVLVKKRSVPRKNSVPCFGWFKLLPQCASSA